jgi:dTDP-4-amino-4,6-dideoxygalactose transaminase
MAFDLGWSDLVAGAWACLAAGDRPRAARAVEASFGPAPERTLATLSVRSGFSALLAALALPPGSRVAFSAVTIRDMPRIAAHHGLAVDAFDLDPETLAPDLGSLRRVLMPETRLIVVAHLFGARCDLAGVRALARERGILVVEDCAQAWTGDGWRGHPETDVALFSFGPIKTATALGGGVLRFRSLELRDRVAAVQAAWPVQATPQFARRVAKFAALSALGLRAPFTLFTAACDMLGVDWDALIAQSARGFHGGDFFARIHTQPCAALLALLAQRLRQEHGARIGARAAAAAEVLRALPATAAPGAGAPMHSHWVLPLAFERPDEAAAHLRHRGFDATRGTSSMTVVGAEPERVAPRARAAEARWLYVPCHGRMRPRDRARLCHALREANAGVIPVRNPTIQTLPTPIAAP